MLLAFSPDGRHLAAAPFWGAERALNPRVWDLQSGEVRVLDTDFGQAATNTSYLRFDDERYLRWVATEISARKSWEALFDVEKGSREVELEHQGCQQGRRYSSGKEFVVELSDTCEAQAGELRWRSLVNAESRSLKLTDISILGVELDSSDRWIVTAGSEGTLGVHPVSGEEPHLLFGHRGMIISVAISPDGNLIASGAEDGTVRLWPTPDLSKPPLHALSHDELISELKSLTNLRIVEDPEYPSGWKLNYAPFPGWQEVPEW